MSQPSLSLLRSLQPLEAFTGFGGVPLKISLTSWSAGTPTEAVLDGSAAPCAYVATQDGRHVCEPLGWHDGDSDDVVYFERYRVADGVLVPAAHGWIDRTSRQLVQAG